MAKVVKETKGPVGEDVEPIPTDPGSLAELAAAQATATEMLGKMGTLLYATAARGESLAKRLESVEQSVVELAEVVRQMHGALQTALTLRRF